MTSKATMKNLRFFRLYLNEIIKRLKEVYTYRPIPTLHIPQIIFACLFSIHNTISLSRHKQVCLSELCFERYFSHHQAMKMIMSCIFKGNMRTFTETVKLTDKKKLRNVTN